MPSFDIVSRTNLAEIDNAIDGIRREISQRFDFKHSTCTIAHKEGEITIVADDDLKLRQMHELLRAHLTRRKVDADVLDFQTPQKAAGQSLRQTVLVRQGITGDLARTIVKSLKSSKLKVQIAIQGDELRISGKKRNVLQAAIAHVKAMDTDQPLQYVNFRD